MVKVEDAVIARWETGGNRFEVLVDPKAVQDLKDGKDVDLSDKLALDQVFKDVKKGDKIRRSSSRRPSTPGTSPRSRNRSSRRARSR